MSRSMLVVFCLVGGLGGCGVPRQVRPKTREPASVRPATTVQEHWDEAKKLAKEGHCGAAVFHLALALRVGQKSKPTWTRVPALVACVEKLSPPTVPEAKRVEGSRGLTQALWISRQRVSGGLALVGMDPRARAAWNAWGGAVWRPVDWERVRGIRVGPFWMGACEVTVGQWNDCVAAGVCHGHRSGSRLLPVRGVRPAEAAEYCRWRGGRLPTRAEWVRAARGESPSLALYPWGDWWAVGCARIGGGPGPAPVGTHPCDVSPFGVADMGGNVAELVLERRRPGSRALIVGASWADSARWALVAAARRLPRSLKFVGFRCVWEAE